MISLYKSHVFPFALQFCVRVAKNLSQKPKALNKDPFTEPFETGLFITKLDARHNLLLNKFNVVDRHVIIATVDKEHQNSFIRSDSFYPIWRVVKEMDGLAFFNRGIASGASQPHKHYQIVPREISHKNPDFPVSRMIMDHAKSNNIKTGVMFKMPQWSWRHLCCVLSGTGSEVEEELEQLYRVQLQELGIEESEESLNDAISYNWLMTRDWMMIIPRTKEAFIHEPSGMILSINSLAFAGTLFFKSEMDLNVIKSDEKCTFNEILKYVSLG